MSNSGYITFFDVKQAILLIYFSYFVGLENKKKQINIYCFCNIYLFPFFVFFYGCSSKESSTNESGASYPLDWNLDVRIQTIGRTASVLPFT